MGPDGLFPVFEKDFRFTMTTPTSDSSSKFIQIAEMLHASIPEPGKAMAALEASGDNAFSSPSEALGYLTHLIAEQAAFRADYLDVNLDALNSAAPTGLMRQYMNLIDQFGQGTPPSVDSSNIEVLEAGLDAWLNLGRERKPALVNSIPYHQMEAYQAILSRRAQHPFRAVCLLTGMEGPLPSSEAIVEAARDMFRRMRAFGFEPDDLFFDTVTLGVMFDGCLDSLCMPKPTHTHNAFRAIEILRNDPEMRGVHAIFGASNWAHGVKKRRVGHLRAYIEAARRRGLDAAIVDVRREFDTQTAPEELVGFVEAFAALDGGENSMEQYGELMHQARQAEWL
jgi:cobalamin-dependent methionine synthase I